MSKYITKLLMVVLLFVTFTNCTEDGVFVTEALEHSNTPNFRISNINSKAVLSNDLVSKSLSRFRSKGESMSTNKIIYNSDYGFSIDTDHVKYLENTVTGAHSYNFKITRDTPQTDAVENLVLMSTTVGGYKAYIVNYNLTGEEIDNANEAQMLANTSVYTPIDFDLDAFDPTAAKLTNELVCVEYYEWGSIPNDEGNLNGDTPLFTYGWIQTGQDCFWVYGGGDGDGGDGSGDGGFSSGPSGNGGGGGYSNNGNNYSDPTYDPSDPDIHGNGGIISVPNDDDPPCQEADDAIIAELESVFGAGNFSTNCNIESSDIPSALHFNTVEELQAFYDAFQEAIQNPEMNVTTTIIETGTIEGNKVAQHFQFIVDPFVIFNFFVIQQLGQDYQYFTDYSVTDLQTLLSGLTFFNEWNAGPYVHSMDSYNSIVDIYGTLDFKVYFKGLGTISGEAMHFNLVMNATDGSFISQSLITD